MMRILLWVLAAAVCSSSSGAAQAPALFKSLEGRWECAGGFPDGRALAADLAFTLVNDGRLLKFSHVDRAPGTYWQDATWLHDAKNTRVMSLSASGSTRNMNSGAALFVATGWSDSSIVLEADSLKGPPWTANRFRYTLRGAGKLEMRWETRRNDSWVLGDSLVCGRQR